MMGPDYLPAWAAFTTGLLGGLGHCVGMCGPLVASYSFHGKGHEHPGVSLPPHLLYNAGRITTYTFIGSVMGITGSFMNTAGSFAGLQGTVSIVAGIIMVFMGLSITGFGGLTNFMERHNNCLLSAVKVVLDRPSVWRYYPLGLLIGFLPCGLSYSIYFASAATGNLLNGMWLAFCFGVGTVPGLLFFGVAVNYIGAKARGLVYKIGGLVVIAMGIYFIFRERLFHL